MDFKTVVKNLSTTKVLKRVASAYVIDFKALDKEDLENALIKTAPQYYFEDNIKKTIQECIYNQDPNIRKLMPIIIKDILLNKNDFKCEKQRLNEEIIKFEQNIVNQSNEFEIDRRNSKKDALDLFSFILEVSWKRGSAISVDEKNLILKIQEKLGISEEEYMLLEAKLGNFPKAKNTLHTHDEINEIRRELQRLGLIFSIRDDDGIDYDIIPDKVAKALRAHFGIEMRKQGYRKLLDNKRVRSKTYLSTIIEKSSMIADKNMSLKEMQSFALENIRPSNVLGGFSPRDGLNRSDLADWCKDLGLPSSNKTKEEYIALLIEYYDGYKETVVRTDDERENYFNHYEKLANRNLETLRQAEVINKDIDCERMFEKATDYIFEILLNVEPLDLIGTKHPDGVLSFSDKLIMWDNKSKETPVNLKDHIKQFDEYIATSHKPVASFLVIGPDFTDESVEEAMKYQLLNDTTITLITAKQLKELAQEWSKTHKEEPFPLGYFKQPGRFNPNLVSY